MVFAPPYWYDGLVIACFVGGTVIFFIGGFMSFIGFLVFCAAIWAVLSNERIACNMALGTYARMEGQGLVKRFVKGSLRDLDALVLITEDVPVPVMGPRTVIYRLVLHWKGSALPPLVVEREMRSISGGGPLNAAAGLILSRGQRYARALGIPFYDNSYYASPSPLPFA